MLAFTPVGDSAFRWAVWADRWAINPDTGRATVIKLRLLRPFVKDPEAFLESVDAHTRKQKDTAHFLPLPRTSLHFFRGNLKPDVSAHPAGGHLTVRLMVRPDQWNVLPLQHWLTLCTCLAWPQDATDHPFGPFMPEIIGITVLHKPTQCFALRIWLQDSLHLEAMRSVRSHALQLLGFAGHHRLIAKFSPHRFVLATLAASDEATKSTLRPPPQAVDTTDYLSDISVPPYVTCWRYTTSAAKPPEARPLCAVLFYGSTPFTCGKRRAAA